MRGHLLACHKSKINGDADAADSDHRMKLTRQKTAYDDQKLISRLLQKRSAWLRLLADKIVELSHTGRDYGQIREIRMVSRFFACELISTKQRGCKIYYTTI